MRDWSDLSQFNILVRDEKPVIIDIGQGVLLSHPMAKKFLERDINNIITYFNKAYFKDKPVTFEEVYKRIGF